MTGRPTRTMIVLQICALGLAIAVAVLRAGDADWDLPLFSALLVLSLVSDLSAVQSAANRVKIAGSFLSIVVAAVLLGPTPAALIGVLTILTGWAGLRYSPQDLLINLVTYAWFPLASGIAFAEAGELLNVMAGDAEFYLLVLATFIVALGIDTALIAGYSAYLERGSSGPRWPGCSVPCSRRSWPPRHWPWASRGHTSSSAWRP